MAIYTITYWTTDPAVTQQVDVTVSNEMELTQEVTEFLEDLLGGERPGGYSGILKD